MYYPDDDTLVIERKDVDWTHTGDDTDSDTSSQASSARRYKGYCSGRLNPDLLLCKIFYFTFYGSYGCLYPLIAVYFKQLGLSATQSGVLVGVRPFVEFCAAPMWGALADSWRRAKAILLLSLFSWLVFTEAVAFVRPAQSTCVVLNSTVKANTTVIVVGGATSTGKAVDEPKVAITNIEVKGENGRPSVDVKNVEGVAGVKRGNTKTGNFTTGDVKRRSRRASNDSSASTQEIVLVPDPNVDITVSNSTEREAPGGRKDAYGVTVIKYTAENTRLIFVYLLLFMILGEFFSSPTITLADSATLGYLGHARLELYGRQRMFGSLAWGIFMFVEGLILDRTKTVTVECDGEVLREQENYMVCFGTYAVLITCAFFVATQFKFKYRSLNEAISVQKPTSTAAGGLDEVRGRGASEVIRLESVKNTLGKYDDDDAEGSKIKDSAIAEDDEDEHSYMEVLSLYASVRYGTVLYVVWFAGFGFGFLFTFLYWHLKDLGGPPTLIGLAAIINHVSEVTGYFFSGWFLRKMGHIPVLCLGLLAYAVRCIAVSYLVNPWWVLLFETLQGVTHALVWAASTSFIGASTPQRNRSSAQGILQGVYHGLGRGCGAIFGGVIVGAYGSTMTFRAIGITYVVVALIFAVIQYMESEDSDKKAEDKVENYVQHDAPEDIHESEFQDLFPDREGATSRLERESDDYASPEASPEDYASPCEGDVDTEGDLSDHGEAT